MLKNLIAWALGAPVPPPVEPVGEPVDSWMESAWRLAHPPISREAQAAAKARLTLPPLPADYVDADGRHIIHWYTGTVDLDDYTRRDGYVVWLVGRDRYGWPVGDPRSPATPLAVAP